MRVLVACEFSGIVREAFRARGHDAVSCDLLESEQDGPHIVGDAIKAAKAEHWDMMIAFPPCTYLCNSGVRWLYEKPGRWEQMQKAARFFRRLLKAPIARIAIENPVMHGHAVEIVGRGPDMTFQPWQFGHGEVKRTCLWLKGLPPLEPTEIVDGRTPRVHHASPGPSRWKQRSLTYPGVAAAMADQWGIE